MLIVIDTESLIDAKVTVPHIGFERGWNHAIDEVIKASVSFADVYNSVKEEQERESKPKYRNSFEESIANGWIYG